MKRSEVLAYPAPIRSVVAPDAHLVHRDAPSVRVHRYVVEDVHGPRYSAELTVQEAGIERSVIDARTNEELEAMIEPAALAFALSIRLRTKARRNAGA